MGKKKRHTIDNEVKKFRNMGEAAHHVGKRMTQQTIKSKKTYSRKEKHKKDLTNS